MKNSIVLRPRALQIMRVLSKNTNEMRRDIIILNKLNPNTLIILIDYNNYKPKK